MVSHIFDKNRLLHTIIGEWLKNIIEIALGYLNIIWLKHSLFINVKKWLPNDINLTSIHHHFFRVRYFLTAEHNRENEVND